MISMKRLGGKKVIELIDDPTEAIEADIRNLPDIYQFFL